MMSLIVFCVLNIFTIAILQFSLTHVFGEILMNSTSKLHLIDDTSKILCNFRVKTVHVYFENGTSMGYSGAILRELSECGISYISIRNRVRTTPLEAVKDDGVLMHLLMILHNTTQSVELGIIQKKSAAKHLSYVLLLIEDSSLITKQWLRTAFQQFWNIWLLNIVIMFVRRERLHIYRYNPFTEDFLIKIDYKNQLPDENELFPKSLPNMHGKPLRMCIYPDEIRAIFKDDGSIIGIDGLMSRYIAERLNATWIVDKLSVFDQHNRSTEICFNEIYTEKDDIAMNIRFLSLKTFHRRVESTVVHLRDDLSVLVPKAKIATTFWNLFRTFHSSVWLPIFLSIPLAYTFCVLFYRRLCFSNYVLLQLFASTLSMPFSHIPTKLSLRLFLFFWLFYGMLICNAFKGNLTSNLVFRKYLPDINTIKDLALSPYRLLMFPRHIKHLDNFLNMSNPYEAIIKTKMTAVSDITLFQYLSSNNITYAYLQKFHVAHFQAHSRNHSHFGRPLYHLMSTCLVPFHAVFIVPYGSPYLGFFNTLIRSAHEFGFNIYWEHLMNVAFWKAGKSVLRSQKNDDDPVVLKLPHFQAAFFLLVLGLALAFLALLWEIWEHKRH